MDSIRDGPEGAAEVAAALDAATYWPGTGQCGNFHELQKIQSSLGKTTSANPVGSSWFNRRFSVTHSTKEKRMVVERQ
jgi:hypothetical protein